VWPPGHCSRAVARGKKSGVTVMKVGLIVPLTGDIAAMGQGMNNGATLFGFSFFT